MKTIKLVQVLPLSLGLILLISPNLGLIFLKKLPEKRKRDPLKAIRRVYHEYTKSINPELIEECKAAQNRFFEEDNLRALLAEALEEALEQQDWARYKQLLRLLISMGFITSYVFCLMVILMLYLQQTDKTLTEEELTGIKGINYALLAIIVFNLIL